MSATPYYSDDAVTYDADPNGDRQHELALAAPSLEALGPMRGERT